MIASTLIISPQEAARRADEVERLVPLAVTQEERDALLRLASDLWLAAYEGPSQ